MMEIKKQKKVKFKIGYVLYVNLKTIIIEKHASLVMKKKMMIVYIKPSRNKPREIIDKVNFRKNKTKMINNKQTKLKYKTGYARIVNMKTVIINHIATPVMKKNRQIVSIKLDINLYTIQKISKVIMGKIAGNMKIQMRTTQ